MNQSPARIVLETSTIVVGYDLASDIERHGLGAVEVRSGVGPSELRHGPGTPAGLVSRLLETIRPLAPDDVRSDDSLAPNEILVRLGERSALVVDVRADSPALLARTTSLIEKIGLRVGERHLEVQDHSKLHHASAPAAGRQLLRWALTRTGLVVEEQDHGNPSTTAEARDRIELRLRDPELANKPFGERFGVQIHTDDLAAGEDLANRLRAEGFRNCTVVLEEDEDEPHFNLHPGPFSSQRAPNELTRLRQLVEQAITRRGLDLARFPLTTTRNDRGMAARIDLPIGELSRPGARPYAGAFPDRFDVILHTDDVASIAPVLDALHKAGFTRVEVKEVPSLLDNPHAEHPAGLVVRWSAAAREKAVATAFRTCVEDAMKCFGGLPLEVIEQPGNGVGIYLFFPVKGVRDGRLVEFLADPRRYHVRLAGFEGSEWADLKTQLEAMGFAVSESPEGGVRPRGRLEYASAPAPLVERVQGLLTGMTGSPFPPRRVGGDEMLITVALPRRVRKLAVAKEQAETLIDVAAWLGEEAVPARRFVDIRPSEVRVGAVSLPSRKAAGAMVPKLDDFDHFCLDTVTAATLEHLAAGVLLSEPCLLEGETSTSKTTAIQYLAALLHQPLVRINLNGQTDTGELIGRFIPCSSDNEDTARSASEGMWCWQDGLVVQAMRRGWWVLLDEVNLAEPQILERLNSVLEVEPTLILTEYDNSIVHPVHPSFRVFATMNPAEYAGRSVLSPAYRDRWRGYRYVPRPGEAEYLAMLRLLVHGEQPAVVVQGRRYLRDKAMAPYGALAKVLPNDVLVGLARFQVSLEHAAGRGGESPRLGVRRKERHVFTRRGLLSVLDFLASPLGAHAPRAVRSALARYYLGRVSDPHDQTLVIQLLEAAGLGTRVKP